MKQVKSKITGDIGELDFDSKEGVFIVVYYDLNTKETVKSYYKSLEDLCEEWEDVPEEPKEYWYISDTGDVCSSRDTESQIAVYCKEIGNYFETKEEAERAVEKLKAWKRLRDKGYYFKSWKIDKLHFSVELRVKEYDFLTKDLRHDLGLLFGGEE